MRVVGEHRVVEQCCSPTEVTGVKGLLSQFDDTVDSAHCFDVSGGQCFWRVWPQSRRVSVEPAHVALVDRLDVVTDRAVVPVSVPRLVQCQWHLEHYIDLNTGATSVQQPQCLV